MKLTERQAMLLTYILRDVKSGYQGREDLYREIVSQQSNELVDLGVESASFSAHPMKSKAAFWERMTPEEREDRLERMRAGRKSVTKG